MSFIAGVYPENTFDTENPDSDQQAAQAAAADDLASSGMHALMLASFHVSKTGDINYNDTNIVTGGKSSGLLNADLPTLLAKIHKAGVRIVASFGGGGMFKGNAIGFWDFSHIAALIEQYPTPADNPFFKNLDALFTTYPAISGVDIDLESYSTYDQFSSTLVTLIQWLSEKGKIATIAPYGSFDFWAGVLEQCVVDNKQQVAWVNLQNASGTLSDFVTAFGGATIGWTNVPEHTLAGQQIGKGASPSDVQEFFYEIGQQQSGLRGGWLWTYENFDGTAASGYTAAIQAGLGGTA